MRNKIVKKIFPQNILQKNKTKYRQQDLPLVLEYKEKLQNIMENQFGSHNSEDLKFYEREVNIKNHKGYICGYFDDDYSAGDYLLMRCEERYPKGIILTEFSLDDYNYIIYGSDKYEVPPKIEPFNEKNLLGRQMLLSFYKNELKYSLRYFKDYGDHTIAEIDKINRRKILNINLTLGYWACFKDDVKLMIGAPQKLLVIEDLAVSLELKELKNIFHETLKTFVEYSKEDVFDPSLNVKEFYTNFKDVAKNKFSKVLYEKKCIYSGSVVRKVHKLFNNNMIAVDNDLVQNVFRHCVDENCPEFDKVYRDEDFYNNLENIDPTEENLKIILEKIVILNHIFDREFRNYIDHKVNPIKGLFGNKFDVFDDNYVIGLYYQINSLYAKILESLFYNDAKRLEEVECFGRFFLQTYGDQIKKIEEEKGYSFLVDKTRKINELKFIFQMLLTQISINLMKKEDEGIDVSLTKLELKKLFSGVRTKENLNIYNELLVEANTQLGLIKFPESFGKNFTEIIKSVSYNDLKNLIGEDPMTKFENAQIALSNQMKGIDPCRIKEGWEEPMKKNIIKQEKILDMPNKLLSEVLNRESKKNKDLNFDINIFKDNKKLIELISSEYDNMVKSDKDLTEISDTLILGKGTENEKRILYKDIKEKSVSELKELGFQEITSFEMKLDNEGNLKTNSESMPPELAKKLEEEYRLSEQIEESDLYENTNRHREMNKELKILAEIVSEQDEKKMKLIMNALESGHEYNHPIYYKMIMTKEEWMKKRVNYLKEYFTGQVDYKQLKDLTYQKHRELAEKYDSDASDADEIYHKFMSPEEKKYTLMLRKSYTESQELDKDQNYEEAKLFETDDDECVDYRTFINDRVKELKRDDIGKKNYDLASGQEIPLEDEFSNKYNPGSSRKKRDKNLRKL